LLSKLNLFNSLNRTLCGGHISPYSVISVARSSCWGPDKQDAEDAEIDFGVEGEGYEELVSPSPAD